MMITTRSSLEAQQRRTWNITRRWNDGRASDDLMADAEQALAEAYTDAATWVATSTTDQGRYTRLAQRHLNVARTLRSR